MLKRYLHEMRAARARRHADDKTMHNLSEQIVLAIPRKNPSRCSNASCPPRQIPATWCSIRSAVRHDGARGGKVRSAVDRHRDHALVHLADRKATKDAFPGITFDVHGAPKDLEGARDLSNRDKYQFQWWAVSLVDAVPFGGKKKGADGGIDGHIFFRSGAKTTEKAIVSVKGGGVGVKDVRELTAVVDRERAKIGVYISLEPHTRADEKRSGWSRALRRPDRQGAEDPTLHHRRIVRRQETANPADGARLQDRRSRRTRRSAESNPISHGCKVGSSAYALIGCATTQHSRVGQVMLGRAQRP